MEKSTILTLLISVLAMVSCKSGKEPRQLFEEQQSGVCMVLNSYYYQVTLPNGTAWYCSGIDEDGSLSDFTLDEDEIKKHKVTVTGTAFFIDDKGTLMTNRHVVSPIISKEDIKKTASSLIEELRKYVQQMRYAYYERYEELEREKSDCYYVDYWGNYEVNQQQYQEIQEAQEEIANDYAKARNIERDLAGMDMTTLSVASINEIGIAYNDTYVTGPDDFLKSNPCVVTKVSDDENTDLALIQLKDKKTPVDRYAFKIKGRDKMEESILDKVCGLFDEEKEDIEVGKDLYMIGFNAGIFLGNTQQGVKAQMTSGKVTQQPDGKRVLYSISTLQGSSGSPVIDGKGYVRAVNFAKLKGTDTFNFGIPENLILKFLDQQ